MTALDDRPVTADWALRAACRGINTEIFFPPRIDSAQAATAAAFCDRCPIAAECLGRAYEEHATDGVRAGRLFDAGHSKEITKRPSPIPTAPPTPGRGVPYPPERKAAAIARCAEVRHLYDSDKQAFRAVAAEYGLHPVTLGDWVRVARRATKRATAAVQGPAAAGTLPGTDTTP